MGAGVGEKDTRDNDNKNALKKIKKEGKGVNTSTRVDEDRGGGVDVFVSNTPAHVFVPEVRFFTTIVVVVTIMMGM